MKQKRRATGKNRLAGIQVGVQERMIPIPGAPEDALNTGLNPAPEELGIKEVRLIWDTGKALGKDGESQARATSRIIRKISMALINKKGLGVKKMVILSQIAIEKDHTQQISQAVVENKGMVPTQRIGLSVLTNMGLTQMNL